MIVDGAGTASIRKSGIVWLAIAGGLLILPYLVLAAFAHPMADDFTYAFDTQRDGWWAAYRAQYANWNGRYMSNVFELANPLVWGSITCYRMVAVAMIFGTAWAAYLFIRALTRDAWTRAVACAAAALFTALFVATVPALGESLYWYTSTATYQLSAILAVVQAALVIRAFSAEGAHGAARLAIAWLLLLAVAGMNEVAMLLMAAFYAVLLVAGLVDGRRRVAVAAGVMLAGAVASGLVVWLAPGNGVRSAMYPVRHNMVRSLALTALQTVRFGAEWTTSGPLILASLLYLPTGASLARRTPIFRAMTRFDVATLALCACLTIPIAVFPPYWATGVLGQHRTTSVTYMVFLLVWFTVLTAVFADGELPAPTGLIADRRLRAAAAVLLIGSVGLTHNGYRVALDIATGRAAEFNRELNARYDALRACSRTRESPCIIRPLTSKPEAFYIVDVSSEPGDWVNTGYAYYFGTAPSAVRAVP
jgi:hypothetical protein